MFPLLFNLMVKALPILMKQFEENQWLQGIRIQGVLKTITIVQYTNDTMLFLSRIEELEVKLHRCILIFSIILRLRINLYKSCLIGMGMEADEVHAIVSLFSCQIGSLSMRYFGLQLGGRLCDIQSWNGVMDLVHARLAGW